MLLQVAYAFVYTVCITSTFSVYPCVAAFRQTSVEEKSVRYIVLAVRGEWCNLASYPIWKVSWFRRNCGNEGEAEEQGVKALGFDQTLSVYTVDVRGGVQWRRFCS